MARDLRLVRADASTYAFPPGDLVVYLYNPFAAPVLDAVLVNLRARPERREVVLLYHTPVQRATVEASEAFELTADLGFGLVYRLRP